MEIHIFITRERDAWKEVVKTALVPASIGAVRIFHFNPPLDEYHVRISAANDCFVQASTSVEKSMRGKENHFCTVGLTSLTVDFSWGNATTSGRDVVACQEVKVILSLVLDTWRALEVGVAKFDCDALKFTTDETLSSKILCPSVLREIIPCETAWLSFVNESRGQGRRSRLCSKRGNCEIIPFLSEISNYRQLLYPNVQLIGATWLYLQLRQKVIVFN